MKKFLLACLAILSGLFSFSQHVDSVVVSPSPVCKNSQISVTVYHHGYNGSDSLYAFISDIGGSTYSSGAPIYRGVFTTIVVAFPVNFNYTIPNSLPAGNYRIFVKDTINGNQVDTFSNLFVVSPNAGISLSSSSGTAAQTVCINNSIANITYAVTNATGAGASGLPSGVSGSYSGGVFTISGTPTTSGTFNYTVTTTGGCSSASANGTITVNPNTTISLTSSGGTTSQTVCINTAITNITYTVGNGGTGAGVTGLPAGVSGNYSGGTFTISGTPTVSGTFNYTVTTTGGCSFATATGTITVNPNATISLLSSAGTTNQTVCINTAITNISYTVGNGGTGAGATGLPPGVTGTYNGGTFTISGTPTASGTFNYTVTTTGGCSSATAVGTITVNSNATITLTSGGSTSNQSVCINTAITNITYIIGNGGTGAGVSGLPTGVTGTYNAGGFTISGTPVTSGTFNYTVSTTGGCSSATATGTIVVNPDATSNSGAALAAICKGSSSSPLGGAVGGSATGGSWSDGAIGGTFSPNANDLNAIWTPPASYTGTATLTLTSSGGCGTASSSKTQVVRPMPTASLTLTPSTVCQGNTITLTISIGNAVANLTTYAIGTSPGASDIQTATTIASSGSFSTTKIVSPPLGNTTYYLTVSTSPCASVSSNASVTVLPGSSGGALSLGAIVCPATTNSTVFILSGKVGTVQKWQQSTDGGSVWTDISNTTTTHTATNITVSTLFRAVVQSGGVCPPVNSKTAGVFVNTSPTANFTNTVVCFNLPPTVFTNTSTPGTTLSAAQQTSYNIPGTINVSNTYSWDFGDPPSGASNTSTSQNPNHAYSMAGSFNTSLTTTTTTTIGTAMASCSNSKTNTVAVVNKPAAPSPAASNPSSICLNQKGVNFKTDTVSGLSYLWSSPDPGVVIHGKNKPNTIIDFPASGGPFNIYITAISPGGCRDSTKIIINSGTLTPNPPVIQLTSNGKTLVCLDNKQASYQWGYDDRNTFMATNIPGATLQDYTPAGGFDFAGKNYYVRLVSGGCSYKVYYNAPSGIAKIATDLNIRLQPNPNQGSFLLIMDKSQIPAYSYVTDILGKKLMILNLQDEVNAINLMDLTPGIYYINVIATSGSVQSLKFIINK